MTYQSHIDPLPLPASIDSCCLFVLIHSQNNISFTVLPQTHTVTAILFPLLCCYSTELGGYVFPSISIAINLGTISLPPLCTIYTPIYELSVLPSVWTPAAYTAVFAGHKIVPVVEHPLLKRLLLTYTALVQSLMNRDDDYLKQILVTIY